MLTFFSFREKEKERKRRVKHKALAVFTTITQEMVVTCQFHPKSRWEDIRSLVRSNISCSPELLECLNTKEDDIRAEFEITKDHLREQFQDCRKVIFWGGDYLYFYVF